MYFTVSTQKSSQFKEFVAKQRKLKNNIHLIYLAVILGTVNLLINVKP